MESATLTTGDYTIAGLEDRVCLERKSLGDFVSTVIHNWLRFRKELNRLMCFDIAAIVVECNVGQIIRHEYESETEPLSVIGKSHSIWLETGVPTLFWGTHEEAAFLAYRFLRLAEKKLK